MPTDAGGRRCWVPCPARRWIERVATDMVDVKSALDEAGLTNPRVREYVAHWAAITRPDRIEVVSAADDARLLQEAVDAGELQPAGEGRYYSRSYHKDTARSEERTVVATSDEADRGVYNNWKPAAEMTDLLVERMRGASRGKTMYVIPYLMAPPGSPLAPYAAGVELTDTRTVVLHMIRMARVGVEYVNDLADPSFFVRGLHQASYDGWASGEFLAEQFMLLGITDKQTGRTYHVCGGMPSASGKTNLA